ncbi:MAG TPA: glycosyltransferase family 1 protein [Candidatus Limnocylindrales bacterium]|nr:glycosyltransferase family 1 protein [Candidatus Limnocylindrales bacterium]
MSESRSTPGGLRLALDVGPVHVQPAGVGIYAASLARGLASSMNGSLALIGVRTVTPALDSLALVDREPFRSPNYHSWLQLYADGQARRSRARLVHYTNAAAPLGTRLPYVLTVHDLSLVRLPGTHPVARLATVPVMLWSLARARAIVVPSDWTRRELERLTVARRRITVIPHAPAPVYGAEATDDVDPLASLGLEEGRFVLAVGTLEPRKNLARLIEAFELVAADYPELRLVLAGNPGWRYGPILERARSSAVAERIVFAGYQPPAALATLTRSSGAVAYVSIYEGFGMPILDAMSHGAAVVASNRTAMPEAAGGAAVLVDPFDPSDIARGLRRALAERDTLVEAGRARAARRSWDDVAAEHLEVYRWALERP